MGNDYSEQVVDEEEIGSLFRMYYAVFCVQALRVVHDVDIAKDLVQDFFINYWERRKQGMGRPEEFKHYGMRAVRNLGIDYCRRLQVKERKAEVFSNVEPAYNPSGEQEEESSYYDRLQRIFELLEELPEGQRTILKLHALDKMSYLQIAHAQGVSINTVRTQLSRAYSSLRKSASGLLLLALLTYI